MDDAAWIAGRDAALALVRMRADMLGQPGAADLADLAKCIAALGRGAP